ncbi:MAG: TfoX/Sxy family protein [Anaeromicrobium sp.]|uniref:TfoX/Sxy family protein n=1 Tax=Anaeromicrobium sp. TaxID=1929132 RepID=UPI0025D65985|nr:TfoX/Sxy family protein [Anaeromicrobium sp.]MCT4595875.1 TfoX/Sxy family protein [Anaeromicrobium sp.]
MGQVSQLPNIGKVLERQLNSVGIETFEQLKELGSKEAWLRIRVIDKTACINRLCALEGAIQGIRWHHLADDVKRDLNEFYNIVK